MKKILIIIISSFFSLGWFHGDETVTLTCQGDYGLEDWQVVVEISEDRDNLRFISSKNYEYFENKPQNYQRLNKDFPPRYDYEEYSFAEEKYNVMAFFEEHPEYEDIYIDFLVQNDFSRIDSNQMGSLKCNNEEYIDSKKSIFDSLFPKEYENLTEMKEELERIGNITIDFKDYTYEGCGMFGCLESAEFYDYNDFSETFVFRFGKNQKIAEHAIQFFERMCRPRIDVGSTVFCVRFPGSGDKGPNTIKLIESLN